MCVQCMIGAMSTGAAATGARSFLAVQRFSWLTPRRLRLITIALLGAAFLASSTIISGSTPRAQSAAASALAARPQTR